MFDRSRFNAAIALRNETQADAARVMKINPSTLFRKINGESDFNRKEIELFCNHYGVDPRDIFFTGHSAYVQKHGLDHRLGR